MAVRRFAFSVLQAPSSTRGLLTIRALSLSRCHRRTEAKQTLAKSQLLCFFSPTASAKIPPDESKMAAEQGSAEARLFPPSTPLSELVPKPQHTPSPASSATSAPHSLAEACNAKGKAYIIHGEAVDIGNLLNSLPTKENPQAMFIRMEEIHIREIQELRGDLQQFSDKVDRMEGSVEGIDT